MQRQQDNAAQADQKVMDMWRRIAIPTWGHCFGVSLCVVGAGVWPVDRLSRTGQFPAVGVTMQKRESSNSDFVPFEEVQERDLRRQLFRAARAGDAIAQAKLWELYGVRLYTQTKKP